MNKLVEIRNQEFMCRERALLDSERKVFWLAKAEEWEQCALDEIAFHFRECNLDMTRFPESRALGRYPERLSDSVPDVLGNADG